MVTRRTLIALVPALVFTLVLAVLLAGLGERRTTIVSPLIGKPLPALTLPPVRDDIPGVVPADLNAPGQSVLFNVFASWCVPCRDEHPLLMELAESGVTIVGMAYKDSPGDARDFLAELGNPYAKAGLDRSGKSGIEIGLYGVPETYVIDRDGILRYKHVGPLSDEVIARDIRPLLDGGRQP